jgi:predicted Rossmann fold flavoprotein
MTKIAVIGGGPAGVMAAITAKIKNPGFDVTVFDKNEPLKTLLYTGGGRCNLGYFEFDIKELAANYPRGEKFLYSVFSRFGLTETLEFFKTIGVETYVQSDNRIFPVSDKASDVRFFLIKEAQKRGVKFNNHAEVKEITTCKDVFNVNLETFDHVIIATGGRQSLSKHNGFYFAQKLGHLIIDLKPALCGLTVKEKWLNVLSGLVLKDVAVTIKINSRKFDLSGDILLTHEGISGPLVYKISSLCAFENYNAENPIEFAINFTNHDFETFDKSFVEILNLKSQRDVLNILSEYIPRSLANIVLLKNEINPSKKAHEINKNERQKISEFLTSFKIHATSPAKDGEIVTAGGVSLDEINPKTMESKLVKGLYFCGEVLNIDGFTGGFNLQSCWSTGYIAGSSQND